MDPERPNTSVIYNKLDRSKSPGGTMDPGTHHTTSTRPEHSEKSKDPNAHSFRPYEEKSMGHHPPSGTVSTTLKAEVDKDKVLAVTTVYSISNPSKMMLAAKTGTGKQPEGMEQGTAPQSKPVPGPEKLVRKPSIPASTGKAKPPVSAPPPPPPASAAHVKPGHDVQRKSSLASQPGANKNGRRIRFSELDLAEPSGRSTNRGPPQQTADKKVPPVRSSDKYKPGVLRELPENETESQETPLSTKARDDKIKKTPRPTKAEDDEIQKSPPTKTENDGSKKGEKTTNSDVNVKPVVTDNDDKENSGEKAPKDSKAPKASTASKTSKASKVPKKIEQKTVIVQVIFYKFRDLSTAAETFDVEVIFNAKWPEPEFDNSKSLPDRLLKENEYSWSPQLYVENTVKEPKLISKFLTLQYADTGKAFVVESTKVFGKFSEPMELKDFPFDSQRMSLLIRTEKPVAEAHLIFSADDPHLIRKNLYFENQQFRLYLHVESEDLSAEPYDEYGEVKISDELRVTCIIARNPLFYINNCYLLAFLLAILGFWSFAGDAKFTMQRNVLSYFTLVGAIGHKYTLVPHIPKTPYMTHADRYLLAVMVYLGLVSLYHALATLLDTTTRNRLDIYAISTFGGMLLLYNIVIWPIIIYKTKKSRKKLEQEEEKYLEKLKVLRQERASIDDVFND